MPAVTYTLNDSFGDGWNDATYTITPLADPSSVINGTMNAGSTKNDDLELEYDTLYRLEITKGIFPEEISSSIVYKTKEIEFGTPPINTTFYISSDTNIGISTDISFSLTELYEKFKLQKQMILDDFGFSESEFPSEYDIISNNNIAISEIRG